MAGGGTRGRAKPGTRDHGGRTVPVSVALTPEQRDAFGDEGERRGLGLSTTLRTLALERLVEISEEEQLARARRWQRDRMIRLHERIQAGEVGEATRAEIDSVFEEALAGEPAAETA